MSWPKMIIPPLLLGASPDSDVEEMERRFPAKPHSAPAARKFVLSAVAGLEDDDRRLATLVSELATNAIRHARTPFRVKVEQYESRIRVSVSDRSPAVPTKKTHGPQDSTGRGLMIVESYADRWGYSPDGEGKTVWFEIDHP